MPEKNAKRVLEHGFYVSSHLALPQRLRQG